tara:strand:- start:92 stop:484 length:393 start_codon:yes stop_codon:yes gene_type:complete
MRRQFLMDELAEEDWISRLKIIEKKREKNREKYQVLELFKDVGRDILFNIGDLYRELDDKKVNHGEITYYSKKDSQGNNILLKDLVLVQVEEMEKITAYVNQKFLKLEKQFGTKFPLIDHRWYTYYSLRI